MRVILVLFHFLILIEFDSYSQTGSFKDIRDNKNYKTILIGDQTWMAENLNVSTFRNGDIILEAKTYKEWKLAEENKRPAWCYYNYDSKNAEKYGKLYNWYAVNDPRGLAPKGWHIPTDLEWELIIDVLGGENLAGGKLKNTTDWNVEGNGTNDSNFSAYPGGRCNFGGGFDATLGYEGFWWSATEYEAPYSALYKSLSCNYSSVFSGDDLRGTGMSIRCIKD
jgi:uncharacterized protein (TIGR02145 family)